MSASALICNIVLRRSAWSLNNVIMSILTLTIETGANIHSRRVVNSNKLSSPVSHCSTDIGSKIEPKGKKKAPANPYAGQTRRRSHYNQYRYRVAYRAGYSAIYFQLPFRPSFVRFVIRFITPSITQHSY